MRRLLAWWRRWRAEAPQRSLRRTMAGIRRDTAWLQKRPFSDKYDGDDNHGGYLSAAAGSSGRSLEDEQPFELKPVPPHPRARRRDGG